MASTPLVSTRGGRRESKAAGAVRVGSRRSPGPWRPRPCRPVHDPSAQHAARRVGATMHLDTRELAAIFAGGFIGAALRAGLVEVLPHGPGDWPWATFAGERRGRVPARLLRHAPPGAPAAVGLPAAVPGHRLCGGLTTFSTMQIELLRMLDPARRRWRRLRGSSVVRGFRRVCSSPRTSCGGRGSPHERRRRARRRQCSAASGAIARFLLDGAVARGAPARFPCGTWS